MIRPVVVFLLFAIGIVSNAVQAQSAPFVRAVARGFTMAEGDQFDFKLQCPTGYIPVEYSLTLGRPFDQYQQLSNDLISRSGADMDRDTLASGSQLEGAGYAVSLFNDSHHTHNIAAAAKCLATSVSSDNTLVIIKTASSAAYGETGSVTSFCPANAPVALSGFSNANGYGLQDNASAPVWGTSASPILLGDVADGQTGPPTGWQMKVFNGNIPRETIISYAVCGNVPGAQAFVYSSPAAFGNFDSVFGSVPDGWTAVGAGFDGAQLMSLDMWMRDGTVVDNLLWFKPSVYDGGTDVRAFIAQGYTNTLGLLGVAGVSPKAGARAVLAVLAVPQTGNVPPPVGVDVIEYYNAALDHYFVTAIPDEIAKLDDGTFVGWTRTGQTFKAYAVGSSGRTGRHPVCRAYGLPSAGLNTHFYSASPHECFATLTNLYGSWALEASEVFEMDFPDTQTGTCPAGDLPVYRIWNQRFDSNHRYTTSTGIRDQMVAKGGIAEGYGPNAVALCALP